MVEDDLDYRAQKWSQLICRKIADETDIIQAISKFLSQPISIPTDLLYSLSTIVKELMKKTGKKMPDDEFNMANEMTHFFI